MADPLEPPAPAGLAAGHSSQGAGAVTADVVLSVLATDRPGLVARLSDTIAAHGGNWIDSSLSRLAGAFGGIIHVAVPHIEVGRLEGALAALALDGIQVLMSRAPSMPGLAERLATLEMTCRDRVGLIRDISAVFARRHVSIEQLETEIFEASMEGGQMFSAIARIRLPDAVDVDDLQADFEALGGDVLADIVLSADSER